MLGYKSKRSNLSKKRKVSWVPVSHQVLDELNQFQMLYKNEILENKKKREKDEELKEIRASIVKELISEKSWEIFIKRDISKKKIGKGFYFKKIQNFFLDVRGRKNYGEYSLDEKVNVLLSIPLEERKFRLEKCLRAKCLTFKKIKQFFLDYIHFDSALPSREILVLQIIRKFEGEELDFCRRAKEKNILEEMDEWDLNASVFQLFGVEIPREILVHKILPFLGYNLNLLYSVGLAGKDLYTAVLSSWDNVTITKKNLIGISLLVLRNVRKLTIACALSRSDLRILFSRLSPHKLKEIYFSSGYTNNSVKTFLNFSKALKMNTANPKKRYLFKYCSVLEFSEFGNKSMVEKKSQELVRSYNDFKFDIQIADTYPSLRKCIFPFNLSSLAGLNLHQLLLTGKYYQDTEGLQMDLVKMKKRIRCNSLKICNMNHNLKIWESLENILFKLTGVKIMEIQGGFNNSGITNIPLKVIKSANELDDLNISLNFPSGVLPHNLTSTIMEFPQIKNLTCLELSVKENFVHPMDIDSIFCSFGMLKNIKIEIYFDPSDDEENCAEYSAGILRTTVALVRNLNASQEVKKAKLLCVEKRRKSRKYCSTSSPVCEWMNICFVFMYHKNKAVKFGLYGYVNNIMENDEYFGNEIGKYMFLAQCDSVLVRVFDGLQRSYCWNVLSCFKHIVRRTSKLVVLIGKEFQTEERKTLMARIAGYCNIVLLKDKIEELYQFPFQYFKIFSNFRKQSEESYGYSNLGKQFFLKREGKRSSKIHVRMFGNKEQ